ncbi:putative GPI-anchored cupredoxin [Ceratocystis lukuohia]|uniref:GPI-anchored cupredoxin n=1 Tax=Ceratocystis lukuohia TaxID=2019550 RepID=A0ABR4MHJ2_9PEZI
MRFTFAALLAATAAMAIPTAAPEDSPSEVAKRATHVVRVGDTIEPANLVASVGDKVEFHFLPGVHSVVRSSYIDPCSSNGGFASTSVVTPNTQSQNAFAFVIEVKSMKPIWYYNGAGSACQSGVVGSINSPEKKGQSIDDFRRAAKTEHYTENPLEPKGGRDNACGRVAGDWKNAFGSANSKVVM